MLGSSGGLGFGFAFTLEDRFTNTARQIEGSFARLGDRVSMHTSGIANNMSHMATGMAMMRIGSLVARPMLDAVKNASDLNESMTKLEAVFGQNKRAVLDFTNNSAAGLGLSNRAALEATGIYGNLFTSLGMDKSQAASYSVTLTKLAADLASFNNTDIKDALNALKSGMVGNTMPLKRYGIAFDKFLLKKKAMEMGLIDSTKVQLSSFPLKKMQATFALIMEQSKNAQGDFMRTGHFYANMTRKIKAAADNLKTDIGQISLNSVTFLASGLEKVLTLLRVLINTPIGQFFLNVAIVASVLLTVLGAFIVVVSMSRLAMYQLAFAFGETTRVMIWQQLAAGNLRNAYVLMKTSLLQSLTAMRLTWLSMFLGNIAAGNLAVAFGMLTSKIRTTFAALWANPFMKYALIFGAIALAISKATSEFEKMEYKASGLKGTFQTLGGFIQVMKEAFNSWDAKAGTFSVLETTAQKLENLGILKQAIALGTWVVRFYEFGKGVLSVFGTIGNAISEIIDFAGNAINVALAWISEKLGVHIGKWLGITDNASSKTAKWFKLGYAAGMVFIGMIGMMTIAWISSGIAAFSAMLPVLGVIGAIVLAGTILYLTYNYISDAWESMMSKLGITKGTKWFKDMSMFGKALIVVLGLMAVAWYYVAAAELAAFLIPLAIVAAVIATIMILYVLLTRGGEIWTWFKQKAVAAWDYIATGVSNAWNRLKNWVGGMATMGKQMVSNMWEGAKSMMGAFIDWIIKQLLSIPILGDALRATFVAGNAIGNAVFGDNTPQAAEPIPAYSANNVGMQVGSYRGSLAANSAVAAQNTNPNLWKSNITMNNHLHLDGEKIATSVNNYNEFNESRGE